MKLTFPILLVLTLLIPFCRTDAATFTVTSTADSGPGTLRDALASASNGDTVDATGISGTIWLTSGELLVNKSVAILGPGPTKLAVDGNESSRVFHIGPGVVVDLTGLTITNGIAPYQFGGGIYNDHATLIVSNCVVSGNFGGGGAGIINDGSSGTATLTVVNSLITSNVAPIVSNSGGGILNFGQNGSATTTLVNSTVSGNDAGAVGGGICNNGSDGQATLTLDHSIVTGNQAGNGGGVYNGGTSGTASLTITNSTITGNLSWFRGGGIYNASDLGSAPLTVVNSIISGNTSTNAGGGGGIYSYFNASTNAPLTVVNSTITGNQAPSGGGVFNEVISGDASLTFVGSIIRSNSASSTSSNLTCAGGGIYNVAGGAATAALVVSNCVVSDNSVSSSGSELSQGGGIFNDAFAASAALTIVGTTLSGNSAGDIGGGIDNNAEVSGNAALEVENSTLSGNSADVLGGGIYNQGADSGNAILGIVNSTFSSNSAGVSGGIHNIAVGNGSATVLIGSTILNAGISGLNISNDLGIVMSLGYNLSSDDGGGVLTNATDQINADPLLGPLQDNGGPRFTCALLPGSPAIDQGKNFSGTPYDQRGPGFARTFDNPFIPNAPGGDGTDIGAFEVQLSSANPTQAVQHLLDMVNSQVKRPQPLDATLKAALASINRNNPTAAINQLTAFQNQVRAQVMRSDPVLAAALLQAAQNAINGLNAAQH